MTTPDPTTATNPIDAIIMMGSDSDWSAMKHCHDLLNEFGVTHEVIVASAHRTPSKVHAIAANCPARGVKTVIAAAGMAAHLAGTLAALVPCPVIGVPMKGGMMDGLDALLSTVQMPPGVPVATVGVGNSGAKNAAILAAQIVGPFNPEVATKLADWRANQANIVNEKDRKLRESLSS